MRNYKLLDALEAYLLAEKETFINPAKEMHHKAWLKRVNLEKVIADSTTEDIKEMIQDVRDYWETLKPEIKPEIKMVEYPIGDTISFGDNDYVVSESGLSGFDCDECDFQTSDDFCRSFICAGTVRSDQKSVIAKRIKE